MTRAQAEKVKELLGIGYVTLPPADPRALGAPTRMRAPDGIVWLVTADGSVVPAMMNLEDDEGDDTTTS